MNSVEKAELVRDCLRYAKGMALPRPLPTRPEDYEEWRKLVAEGPPDVDEAAEDAWFEVYRLLHDSPDEAWEVLRALIAQAETEDELGTIGAGILESFVRENGSTYVNEIENEMNRSPGFVTAMRMVNTISQHPELSDRISHILGS